MKNLKHSRQFLLFNLTELIILAFILCIFASSKTLAQVCPASEPVSCLDYTCTTSSDKCSCPARCSDGTCSYHQNSCALNKLICSHNITTSEKGINAEWTFCQNVPSIKAISCNALINTLKLTSFVTGPTSDGVCQLFIPIESYKSIGIGVLDYGKTISFDLYITPTDPYCSLGAACSHKIRESGIITYVPPPKKLICSHSILSPTSSEGIKAEITYCNDAISEKGNRCGALIKSTFGVSEKFIDGNTSGAFGMGNDITPSTEGVCKISIPTEEYKNFGIGPIDYGKPLSITLYISPPNCLLGNLKCSDFVDETIVVNSPRKIPPPNKLICSSKFKNPATKKTGVTGEISICSEFVGIRKSRCALFIKDKFFDFDKFGFSGDSIPWNDGKCSLTIIPKNYSLYGITPADYGKTVPVSIVFSPAGCISADPTCSEAAEELILIENPLILNAETLDKFVEDCKGLTEGLLAAYDKTHIRTVYITANRLNRIIKLIKGAIKYFTDDNLDLCNKKLSDSVMALETAIDQFERVTCTSSDTNNSTSCISDDVAEEYILRLNTLLSDLENAISINICGS